MKRDIARLADEHFDLLVIGGGIYGAALAWDAALRGLSVALIERSDFGQATSANSLKVVHGGLRYLQDARPDRMRRMVRERRAIMRMAPHLVRPMAFLLPTTAGGLRSMPAMRLALLASDGIGFDRNRGLEQAQWLPPGRVISRDETIGRVPGLAQLSAITGAALWYDAQIYNTERFLLAVLKSAVEAGAAVVNYAEACQLIVRRGRVVGATVHDQVADEALDVRARVTVNAAGPWVDTVLAGAQAADRPRIFWPSLAVNLVTRPFVVGEAVGFSTAPDAADANGSRRRAATLFAVPWRDRCLVGTFHLPYSGGPEPLQVEDEQIRHMLETVNRAYPAADLSADDVSLIHAGLLPVRVGSSGQHVVLIRDGWLVDHRRRDDLAGLLTVVGVKYTAARELAERAVDWVTAELGRRVDRCRTETELLHGARQGADPVVLADELLRLSPGLQAEAAGNLASLYGTEAGWIVALAAGGGNRFPQEELLRAQTRYAVREEMALHLGDVVLRRMDLGSAGRPTADLLQSIAKTMGDELAWRDTDRRQELDELDAHYADRTYAAAH
jgi:glycerol-3-phosphate dehydrogenase